MGRFGRVAVVGLGAMGSATARALARRGHRVIGFDRFEPPHALGSSHGASRIIREAYFEHPAYVPLVQRAYQLWEELERESGRRLLLRTGGLMIGRRDGVLIEGALASARAHGLAHERLDAAGIGRRVPVLEPGADMVGVWEPRAGVLFPEAAVAASLESAGRHGALLHTSEPVLSWSAAGDDVLLRTPRGEHHADRLVIASGAWFPRLVPELALPLAVERVPLYWFEPREHAAAFEPARFPVFILEHAPGRFLYGFPRLDGAIKLARHHEGAPADPDHPAREPGPDEVESMRATFRPFLPAADGPLRETAVCMYTNTPDGHFVIGLHPRHPQVVLVSACSGHGFKFAPAIGEIAAELAVEGGTPWDLGLFAPGRFEPPGAAG